MKNSVLFISIAAFLPFYIHATGIKITLPNNINIPDDTDWSKDAAEANKDINYFEEPNDVLNYADYHYVGAHNAHVYPRFFQTVRQQDQTTLGQLSCGIRGFMWDTYTFDLSAPAKMNGPAQAKVCLSHGKPGFLAFTQKGNNTYQSLQYELRRLIEFMKIAKKAVVTIILEDYAHIDQTVEDIIAVTNAANYDPILKPADWQQADSAEWPTLGWMRKNNKRLIIFTQTAASSSHTWNQFNYCIENQYSTTDESKLCSQRSESQQMNNQRKIVIFNNFSGMAVTQAIRDTKGPVSYDTVKRVTTGCQAKDFAQKRLFNGYFADRVVDSCNDLYKNNQQTVFDYVNELNKIYLPSLPQ